MAVLPQRQGPFHPHIFGPGEDSLDLYHVYDNLSRTPYLPGIGIQSEDAESYFAAPWAEGGITDKAMRLHLNWYNETATRFISFYDSLHHAEEERQRRQGQRFVRGRKTRDPTSVRIVHVRIPRDSNVWVFSRGEMLRMMETFGNAFDLVCASHPREWFVWGMVQHKYVVRDF